VIGSTGTADTSDLGYRALGSFKSDLGLGTSLTQTANNGNGTAGTPAFAFVGDENTGIFRPAADELGFVTNGSEKVRITSAGNVGIGTSGPSGRLHASVPIGTNIVPLFTERLTDNTVTPVATSIFAGSTSIPNTQQSFATRIEFHFKTGDAAFTGYAIPAAIDARTDVDNSMLGGNLRFLTNSSGTLTERMRIDSAGNVGIGTGSPATRLHVNGTIRYTNRPAAGTITAIGFDTNGDLKASSSSLRYKHDIQDYSKGLAEVMQLRPVSFKFNGEDITNIGFIAEEVDALGMTEVMLYDEEQRPDAISYANMVSLLTKAIQEQQSIINELKVRIDAANL
jgi:hypothetical protein